MPEERGERATEGFFGRRRGKPVRAGQQGAVDALLPSLRIDLSQNPPPSLAALFATPVDEVRLEIGFGGGESLLHKIERDPTIGFIGVEPFINGMAKFLASLKRDPGNLRLYDDDATQLLDWLPDGSLAGVDLFYPDPWPKKRHWKRRFVNPANLDRFARVIRPCGLFRFASDIDHYVNWTLREVTSHHAFDWRATRPDDWREPFEGWIRTRYEAKALREGRRGAYLTFVRR